MKCFMLKGKLCTVSILSLGARACCWNSPRVHHCSPYLGLGRSGWCSRGLRTPPRCRGRCPGPSGARSCGTSSTAPRGRVAGADGPPRRPGAWSSAPETRGRGAPGSADPPQVTRSPRWGDRTPPAGAADDTPDRASWWDCAVGVELQINDWEAWVWPADLCWWSCGGRGILVETGLSHSNCKSPVNSLIFVIYFLALT